MSGTSLAICPDCGMELVVAIGERQIGDRNVHAYLWPVHFYPNRMTSDLCPRGEQVVEHLGFVTEPAATVAP